MTHSFIATRWVELSIEWPWDFNSNFTKTNEAWQNDILAFSASYYIFDTLYCLYMKYGPVMITHHLTSLSILQISYLYNMFGYETVVALWLTDVTNPLQHIRWFLRSMEWHLNKWALANEILYVIVFFVNRILIGTYVTYLVFVGVEYHVVFKMTTSALHVVNFIFAYQIFRMVQRKVGKLSVVRKGDDEKNE